MIERVTGSALLVLALFATGCEGRKVELTPEDSRNQGVEPIDTGATPSPPAPAERMEPEPHRAATKTNEAELPPPKSPDNRGAASGEEAPVAAPQPPSDGQ